MGTFLPTPFCQIYPQVCRSDIADTLAKEMSSIGGLAGSGWATPSWGVGLNSKFGVKLLRFARTFSQTLTRPRAAAPAGARTKISANESTHSNAPTSILAPAGGAKLWQFKVVHMSRDPAMPPASLLQTAR
eukprot:1158402-Pelagomonas_calceolata.AAC.9